MNRILILFVALCVSTTAFAQTVLDYTFVEVAPDVYAFEVVILTDQPGASFAADLMFTGPIVELGAFGGFVPVDRETDADSYAANPAATYDKTLDTWVAYPFTLDLPGTQGSGIVSTPASYYISVGTDPLDPNEVGPFESGIRLVQIVAAIPSRDIVVPYAGTISRNSANWGQQGVLEIPEPATLALMGLGGLTMIRRRRA